MSGQLPCAHYLIANKKSKISLCGFWIYFAFFCWIDMQDNFVIKPFADIDGLWKLSYSCKMWGKEICRRKIVWWNSLFCMDYTRFFLKRNLFNEVQKKKQSSREIYENLQGLRYKNLEIIPVQLSNLFKTVMTCFSLFMPYINK